MIINPIMRFSAWILDVTVHREGMLLWLKTSEGKVIQAVDSFSPSFYAVHQLHPLWVSQNSIEENYQKYCISLLQNTSISDVSVVSRRIKAEHVHNSKVLRISVSNPRHFKRVVGVVKKLGCFTLFNIDIPIVQLYFYETELFPFALCEFTGKWRNSQFFLNSIRVKDSTESIKYSLPPLRALWIEIPMLESSIQRLYTDPIHEIHISIDPCSVSIPLSHILPSDYLMNTTDEQVHVKIAEGNEYENLVSLHRVIEKLDPDVIFTAKGDEFLFPYLLARVKTHHIDRWFSLSRNKSPLRNACFRKNGSGSFMSYGQVLHRSDTEFYFTGRLHIDSAIYGGLHFDDGNLYGIIEVGRVTYSPLQRLTRVTIGGALQSLQFFYAYRQGILIAEEKKNAEYFRNGSNLLLSDRGGHILNPQVGMFDRVAELDFTSMYPALMVKYNVSPETINCPCCKETGIPIPSLPYHICRNRKGIVPLALRVPLLKRIKYKELSKKPSEPHAFRYHKMESALKWILVVCFGYLGFRNARFGRIEAHQAVCAFSREFLLNAKLIVEEQGLKSIHGIVDSLYVQPPEEMPLPAFFHKCEDATREIEETTKIPISFSRKNDYFEFMCFLPTKQEPEIGALNRYWGFKPGNRMKVRGIELRRHDTPPFIKNFQEALMFRIAGSDYRSQFPILVRKTIIPALLDFYHKLENGLVPLHELLITIRLSRGPSDYKVQNYQAIAAQTLQKYGIAVGPGEKVSFLIVNDLSPNAEDRVCPVQLLRSKTPKYDIRKYKELLVRSVVNLLPEPLSETEKENLLNLTSDTPKVEAKIQKTILAYL